MSANFIKLVSLERLEALFEESHKRAVVLFKHSNSCGISTHVFELIEEVDGDVNVVVIQENRAISNVIAEKIGYRHQSPQAFVIRDGKAVYHATHYGINAADIDAAVCKSARL